MQPEEWGHANRLQPLALPVASDVAKNISELIETFSCEDENVMI